MDQVDRHGEFITLIHYVFQTDPERIACMPNMTEFHSTPYHPNYQRSNNLSAVTCPACKRADVKRIDAKVKIIDAEVRRQESEKNG